MNPSETVTPSETATLSEDRRAARRQALLEGMQNAPTDQDPLRRGGEAWWPIRPLRDVAISLTMTEDEAHMIAIRALRAGCTDVSEALKPFYDEVVERWTTAGSSALTLTNPAGTWSREVVLGYEAAWPVVNDVPLPDLACDEPNEARPLRMSIKVTRLEADELHARAQADGYPRRPSYLRDLLLGRSRETTKVRCARPRERKRLFFFEPYLIPRQGGQGYRPAPTPGLPHFVSQGRLAFHMDVPRASAPPYTGRELWRWGWEKEALACAVPSLAWAMLFVESPADTPGGTGLGARSRVLRERRRKALLREWGVKSIDGALDVIRRAMKERGS